MLEGHFGSSGASIEYGAAGCLFPVDDLDATVLQYRDAQLALNEVDGSNVIVVAPTSLATSYALTQHALTAIPVGSLSTAAQTRPADEIDGSLEAFDVVQIGTWNSDSPNHSLTEFTTA